MDPPFYEFLPRWLAGQPWYGGRGRPRPIGFLRLQDPAGEVGIETHIVAEAGVTYQLPLTYRGRPLPGVTAIATSWHSELGRRWIYDGEPDPVWQQVYRSLITEHQQVESNSGTELQVSAWGFGPAAVAPGTVVAVRRLKSETPSSGSSGVMGRWAGLTEGVLARWQCR